MARKHGEIAVSILGLLADHPDETLTTQQISDLTGIHKSSVSRTLTKLTATLQIERVKSGVYRGIDADVLVDLSSERTQEDNEKTIDKLLSLYDRMQAAFTPNILKALASGDVMKHRKGLRLLKDMTLSMDRLMHRKAIIRRGYDANPEQARQDAMFRKQQELSPPEEEEEDNRVRAWDPVNKKFLD